MKIVIDGATGLLGRNLLFEILKQNINCLDDIEIIILGKESKGISLNARITEILFDDGFNYLNLEKNSDKLKEIISRIKLVEFDLTKPCLGISKEDIEILKKEKIDYFFHIAALSSFFDTPEIVKQLNIINFEGTKHILNLVKDINVNQFIYVGSAYHAGSSQKEIYPDFINQTGIFRNPYEKTKLEAELYIKEFAKVENLKYKIFRITTISGRLIENEIGSINKYDILRLEFVFLKIQDEIIQKFRKYILRTLRNKT